MPALVATAQFHATTEKDANLKTLNELVLAAIRQGADVVVAPECAMYGWTDNPDELEAVAEPIVGQLRLH